MYQMYMPIAKKLYDNVNLKREQGSFVAYANISEQEQYEDEMFYTFSNFKTNKTIGYEGDANISFALIKCLKSIDLPLAEKLEYKLTKMYSRCIITGKTEDICQRFFHYGKSHIENIIQLIERYHQSLSDIAESKIEKNILDLLPIIKQLLDSDSHPTPIVEKFVKKFQNYNLDLTSFCDFIEYGMHKSFVKSINKETQKTVQEIQSIPSKLKIMDGQDFNLIVHSSLTPDELLINKYKESHAFLSTSLIDDKNIRCYQSSCIKFAYYRRIEEPDLIFASSGDASSDFTDDGILTTFSMPDYVPIKNFKSKTRTGSGVTGYSEIILKNNSRPNAIVCYDFVTEQEMQLAERFDIDLILIKTDCYKEMLRNEKRDERYVKKADLSKYINVNTR